MYLSQLKIQNFRQFGAGEAALEVTFQKGVTALVGRNDCGKTAVIDAIRYALLTRDQEYIRVQPEDFHIDAKGNQSSEILIRCKLSDLSTSEKGAFVEYLSYEGKDVSLYVNWIAQRLPEKPGRWRLADGFVKCGADGTSVALESAARAQLASAYLRPLRDAEKEMSPGRGSRLSQILANVPAVGQGDKFNEAALPPDAPAVSRLSLLGLADYFRHGVKRHKGIGDAESAINTQYLSSLSLSGDKLASKIDLTEGGKEEVRLRQILERLELGLLDATTNTNRGHFGLGSNNLLFMACELLLLGADLEGLPLLLIEEPEAHLHPQRQLRLMEFLNRVSEGQLKGAKRSVQVILTTHSPNLASKVPLENMVLLEGSHAFSLAADHTKLSKSDYRFLERFLDVTKANLFFSHGVIVVEGGAEAILLPVLAKLAGTDLTERGVSVVNVGGTGLRRFSTIFQRKIDAAPFVSVPVACLADMDVMPDCAPAILGLVSGDDDKAWEKAKRRWKATRDLGATVEALGKARDERIQRIQQYDGQSVRTFVADHWTLEYDLAYCGLAEEVHRAAWLAANDDPLNEERKTRADVEQAAKDAFKVLEADAKGDHAILCSHIYKKFHSGAASKAITAQYLAEILTETGESTEFDRAAFIRKLPRYIVDAIDHVKRSDLMPEPSTAAAG